MSGAFIVSYTKLRLNERKNVLKHHDHDAGRVKLGEALLEQGLPTEGSTKAPAFEHNSSCDPLLGFASVRE